MRTYELGGGFGRRLNGDYAVPAALAAKALGKPVKLLLTRPDDMRFDSFRSPSIQTLRVAFNVGSKITAMEHHASTGWPTAVMAPGTLPKALHDAPYDPFAIAGADHWYNVGAHRVRALSNSLANRSFLTVFFSEEASLPARFARQLAAQKDRYDKGVESIVVEGVRRGVFRDVPPRLEGPRQCGRRRRARARAGGGRQGGGGQRRADGQRREQWS